jgi:hypothetical protein
MGFIRNKLCHCQSMTGNWKKHVVRWLGGICQRIIDDV